MASAQSPSTPVAKPSRVKRHFTVKQANSALPLVRRIVSDIVQAHDRATALQVQIESASKSAAPAEQQPQLERTLERLQELVDELHEVGCEVKDYSIGLVDFIGRHQGRDVCLCWKLGEAEIAFWHETTAGFAGRKPVSMLEEDQE
jgi:hypothetical protein